VYFLYIDLIFCFSFLIFNQKPTYTATCFHSVAVSNAAVLHVLNNVLSEYSAELNLVGFSNDVEPVLVESWSNQIKSNVSLILQ